MFNWKPNNNTSNKKLHISNKRLHGCPLDAIDIQLAIVVYVPATVEGYYVREAVLSKQENYYEVAGWGFVTIELSIF